MSPSRRRSRSVKLIAAVTILCIAAAAASAALLTASVPVLSAATVLGVVAGIAAAALMSAEIVVIRRLWAQDRAIVADRYRVAARAQKASHLEFVAEMTTQVRVRDAEIAEQRSEIDALRDRVVDAEIESALAQEKLAAERARVQALEDDAEAAASDLASAHADLADARDALAVSRAAEVSARAEIAAWEAARTVAPNDRRRSA